MSCLRQCRGSRVASCWRLVPVPVQIETRKNRKDNAALGMPKQPRQNRKMHRLLSSPRSGLDHPEISSKNKQCFCRRRDLVCITEASSISADAHIERSSRKLPKGVHMLNLGFAKRLRDFKLRRNFREFPKRHLHCRRGRKKSQISGQNHVQYNILIS